MEKQRRTWLRLCIFFGIYMKPCDTKYCTKYTSHFPVWNARRVPGWFANDHARLTILQRFYIGFVVCGVSALYIHGLYWRRSLPTLLLTWVWTVILFSFQVLTHFLILMETVCRRTQHAHFLLLLEEIEVALKLRLRLDVRKNELLRNLQYLVAYFLALSLLGLVLFIITSLWLNYIGYFWNGLWSILTMRIRVLQLLVYVRTLQHYLECLCAKLRQIVAYRLAPQQQLLDIDYGKLGTVTYLLAIQEIYALICKAFHLLNYFCGWSLFGIVICYLLDITCNIYWTLLSLDGFSNRQYYYVAGPLAMLPLLIIIWHVCYLCDKCKQLDRNVAALVNRISVLRTEKSMHTYRVVLQQFAAQLSVQQNEVTAQNFFLLEMRLWVTIFTVTATNLVILDQFLQLELQLLDIR